MSAPTTEPPRLAVDCWDEQRDARNYAGPLPVVAHPPCGPWGRLKHLHTRPSERPLGARAVEQVRAFGGALEQPAHSALWAHCGLPVPGLLCDEHGGFSIAVTQVSWGHVARKPTWLYFVGVDRARVLSGVRSGGEPTHWVSGMGPHARKGRGGFVPPGIKVCSAQQRRRTPEAFARWLCEPAASARVEARP